MLFLGIISWKGTLRFNGEEGGGDCFSDGGGFIFKGGGATLRGIGFDGGGGVVSKKIVG